MATPEAPIVNTPAKSGPIDQADIEGWKNRFNEALAHTDQITAPAPAGGRPWHTSLFGCFGAIDTCMLL
jgi:hypothetical protein